MKKIDSCVKDAVHNLKHFYRSNTECRYLNHESDDNFTFEVALHGNHIFAISRECGKNHYRFSTCGWDTNVTRDRLNACAAGLNLGIYFAIRNFRMHWFVVKPEGHKDMGEFDTITEKDVEAAR